MNKEEFCLLIAVNPETLPEQDFIKINAVYVDHPSIHDVDGKKQIALIYTCGGMKVIDDMYKRVIATRNLFSEVARIEAEIKNICADRDKEIEEVMKRYSEPVNSRYKMVNELKENIRQLANK